MESQGCSGDVVDSSGRAWVTVAERVFREMPRFFSPFVVLSYANYWWWYRTAIEGAASGV